MLRGETVELSDEQAGAILSAHPVPVIRPAEDASGPVPQVTPLSLCRSAEAARGMHAGTRS